MSETNSHKPEGQEDGFDRAQRIASELLAEGEAQSASPEEAPTTDFEELVAVVQKAHPDFAVDSGQALTAGQVQDLAAAVSGRNGREQLEALQAEVHRRNFNISIGDNQTLVAPEGNVEAGKIIGFVETAEQRLAAQEADRAREANVTLASMQDRLGLKGGRRGRESRGSNPDPTSVKRTVEARAKVESATKEPVRVTGGNGGGHKAETHPTQAKRTTRLDNKLRAAAYESGRTVEEQVERNPAWRDQPQDEPDVVARAENRRGPAGRVIDLAPDAKVKTEETPAESGTPESGRKPFEYDVITPAARTEQRAAENTYEQNIEHVMQTERAARERADQARRVTDQAAAEATYEGNIAYSQVMDRVRAARDRAEEARRVSDQAAAEATYAPNIAAAEANERARVAHEAAERAAAEHEAYSLDPEARALLRISQEFGAQIEDARARNPTLVGHLERERNDAIASERGRWDAIEADTATLVRQVRVNARGHQDTIQTIGLNDPSREDKAYMRHRALGFEPTPFLERKVGGLKFRDLFRWEDRNSRRSAPRMVEMYYRNPGDNNMMMVERRDRRTGELISQSVLTNHDHVRRRGAMGNERFLPPRGSRRQLQASLDQDITTLRERAGGRYGTRLSELFGGFGMGAAIDGGAWIRSNEPTIYERYGATTDQVNTRRYGARRQGGLLYWLSGGRI